MKGWQIVLIVLAVAVAAVVGFGVVGAIFGGDSNDSGVAYTKGAVADGWYVNEWANLKFEITEEWPQGTAEQYAAYENETTDCGFLAQDDATNNQLCIGFEKLESVAGLLSEEDYLDRFEEMLSTTYDDAGIEYEMGDTYNTTIAGETYLSLSVSLGGDMVHQTCCVRKMDGYIIFITVTSGDTATNSAALSSIQAVK